MIKIFPDLNKLNQIAAEKFITIGNRAIEQNGRFAVALAGGSTPKLLYRLLTTTQFKNKIDWTKVFFFLGDERNVSPENQESNFRTANENLFKPLQIPAENIFRWQTELTNAEKIAENYAQTIKNFFDLTENEFPRFDLILLGMGDDGHTASLFPFTTALSETEKIAVSNRVEKLDTTRLTFTFPTINNSLNIIFLIGGASKAETLQQVLEGEFQPEKFPSQAVKPRSGNLFWLVDEQAAQLLK
ncbi:MAG: 6-phosphogluconolactonase [Acidobacteria bacterium]|jgi:6-phosphogluconolactonase|nr:6-phosphogluconolactonase [Acidobacteriota bacterium]